MAVCSDYRDRRGAMTKLQAVTDSIDISDFFLFAQAHPLALFLYLDPKEQVPLMALIW